MRFKLKRCLIALSGLTVFLIICVTKVDVWSHGQRLSFPIRFFARSTDEPTYGKSKEVDIWDTSSSDDRILKQIKYSPKIIKDDDPMKVIYVDGGLGDFGAKLEEKEFFRQNCTIKNCFLSDSPSASKKADAVLFRQYVNFHEFGKQRNPDQVWIYYALESPYSLQEFEGVHSVFNWTATYRRDSTIVTPYAKWVPFDPAIKSPSLDRNFAAGKTKQVVWFVSNCGSNNNRLEYAKELAKHIDVDIIGACGETQCPRNNQDCWEKLNEDYKFYLSFENSNCRDYITEKFFQNGLG